MKLESVPGPGLYRVWWSTGGHSVAAVGMRSDGGLWLAPTNWISPDEDPDWDDVLKLDLIARQDHSTEPPELPARWRQHVEQARALLETIVETEEAS